MHDITQVWGFIQYRKRRRRRRNIPFSTSYKLHLRCNRLCSKNKWWLMTTRQMYCSINAINCNDK